MKKEEEEDFCRLGDFCMTVVSGDKARSFLVAFLTTTHFIPGSLDPVRVVWPSELPLCIHRRMKKQHNACSKETSVCKQLKTYSRRSRRFVCTRLCPSRSKPFLGFTSSAA